MHIWKTTLKQYKYVLQKWFKGTGGGAGVPKEFESWDDAKYKKYDIDPDTYDHTDISSRPPILMSLYSTHRLPYITVRIQTLINTTGTFSSLVVVVLIRRRD